MNRLFFCLMLALFLPVTALAFPAPNHAQTLSAQLALLDKDSNPVATITDGDLVRLRVSGADSPAAGQVDFFLDGDETPVAACALARGGDGCETALFKSLGWRWNPGGAAEQRTIQARLNGAPLAESAAIRINARPVVLVHGFSSNWEAWSNYLGPQGFLAADGIRGYAVGDGQVAGVLNTGSLVNPEARTHTIAENAAILGDYIENVKKATGAQQVDLIAHSMGGLITRYYIDRVMKTRDVAQLIMLGSPMGGTDCANLPAALGFYLPAALEIRPSYVLGIFNAQITRRHGVPFFALAGIPIQDAIGSPCTDVPTDLAVSLESVSDIPLKLSKLPILHTELNTSPQAYAGFVRPLLQKPPSDFADEPDSPPPAAEPGAIQFTRVYTGHVDAGWRQEATIQIEPNVSVASFALFDSTRSLNVEVRGASGNLINLDPVKNGLVVVDDPTSLVYLGYGFQNPKPGPWKITLWATDLTPPTGADYALTAHFKGGSILHAQAIPFLPQVGQPVQLTASIDLNSQPLPLESASAVLRLPDGKTQTVAVSIAGYQAQGSWEPATPGLYGLDITVKGRGAAGEMVERAAFLSVEAQQESGSLRSKLVLTAIVLVVVLVLVGLLAAGRGLWRRRRARTPGS